MPGAPSSDALVASSVLYPLMSTRLQCSENTSGTKISAFGLSDGQLIENEQD